MASRAGGRSQQGRARGSGRAAAPVARGPLTDPAPLQRALGNRATARLLRQPKDSGTRKQQPPAPPRPDYVFIMGEDPPHQRGVPDNPFYAAATDYWKAHLPGATLVTDKRDLDAVLTYLQAGTGPIGSVYIVSHANEDGTLAFSLEATDRGTRLSVPKLREALHPTSGASRLSSVAKRVDGKTKIHIKGCDIGRTRPMIELIDEAFGGAGTVDAPTHEQEYGTDSQLADKARADFRKEIEAAHPLPAAIDPDLKGRAKSAAKRERDKAVKERDKDVAAELKARHDEGETRAALAGNFEAFSGPMFQRPGTKLFTTTELRAEIDRLYPHLSDKRREALAAGLTRMDRGSGLDQHGQRVIRRAGAVFTIEEATSVADAYALFGKDFRRDGFTPLSVETKRVQKPGGFQLSTVIKGKTRDDPNARWTSDATDVFPDDDALLTQAKAKVPNPDSYAWHVEEHHQKGQTTRTAVAERVMTYLHHESLDAGPHQPFTRPLTDKDFYATSTFAPPAPQKPVPAGTQKAVRRLARDTGAPAGDLKAAGPTSAYAKAAADFRRDHANASPAEYAAFLHGKANDALAAVGVPQTKPAWDTGAPFIAQFDANHWTVTMNPRRFADHAAATLAQLTDEEAAGAAATIYHEVRHAEQHFRIARVGVGKLKKDQRPAGPLAALPADVLKEATAHKLVAGKKDDDAAIAEAERWASTATGPHAATGGVVDTWLNEVEAARTITFDPMKSDAAEGSYATFVRGWRGAQRRGFVKDRIKAWAKARSGTVDATMLANLRKVDQAMDKVDTAFKVVERGFAGKGGPGARLKLLQDFRPALQELALALQAAYRGQPHEADAFAAGDEVARAVLAALRGAR